MHAVVHPADIQDRDGGYLLNPAELRNPRLEQFE